MRLDRLISIGISKEETENRILQYFSFLGYRPARPGELRFQRGSSMGSMTAFNPRKWRAEVLVAVSEHDRKTQVNASWNVSTTGQVLTSKDRAFWQTEADDLERALQASGPFAIRSHQVAEETVSRGVKASVVAGVVALVAGATGVLFLPPVLAFLFASAAAIIGLVATLRILSRKDRPS